MVFQPHITVTQHQEDGNYDIVDIDEQTCHKQRVQQLAPLEPETRQAVSCRQRNHQQQHQSQRCDQNGVEHIFAHLGSIPRIDEVLPVESGRQCPGVAVELCVLLDGCHKHPCHRHNDRHSQQDQHKIDKKFVQALRRTGGFFFRFLHVFPP